MDRILNWLIAVVMILVFGLVVFVVVGLSSDCPDTATYVECAGGSNRWRAVILTSAAVVFIASLFVPGKGGD